MRVEASGPTPCSLMLCGEAPGFEEQQLGEPFVGKSGKELWAGMERFCDLSRRDFYVTNIVKNGLPKNRNPKPAELAAALPEFIDEIERVRPRVIVTAGAFATRAVLGDVAMADVHGIPHDAEVAGHGCVCVPIYHPAAGLHNKGFLAAFAYDLGRLAAFLASEIEPWTPGPPATSEWLTGALKGPDGVVSLDTEGWPDKPWGLSLCRDGRRAYVVRADSPLIPSVGKWLKSQILVGHNTLHDTAVLRAMGIEVQYAHDTQLLAFHDLTRTGSGVLEAESQNLGTLAYRECGMRLGELSELPDVDLDAQQIPYSDPVMRYAGEDAVATWRLFDVYRRRGVTDLRPYQIDMGAVPLVEHMVRVGMPFDLDATMDYYGEILEKLETATADLTTRAARLGNRDFNPRSADQVRDLITRKIGLRVRKRTKGGKASTNEKALADHQDHPFVQSLQTHRELTKLKGTYLTPLLEELS